MKKRTALEILALALTALFTLATSVETPCQTDAQCYVGEVCNSDGYCETAAGSQPGSSDPTP